MLRKNRAAPESAVIVARPGGHADAAPATLQGPGAHSVMIRVTDVDALFERVKAAAARVLTEPADHMYGERQCSFLDPWGHPWTLSETVFDSDPAEWGGELLVNDGLLGLAGGSRSEGD